MPASHVATFPPTVERVIKAAGGVPELAAMLMITRNAVYNWKRIPADRVMDISVRYGIPPEELRPDLYVPKVPPKRRRLAAGRKCV